MSKIKVLVIGRGHWIDRLEESFFASRKDRLSVERISTEEAARDRLTHNSYDVLVLDSKFIKNAIQLTKLAYAMTRPSIVLCNSPFTKLKFNFWKLFSDFARRHHLLDKLVHFITETDFPSLETDILFLADNHLQYFNDINNEFKQ